MVIYTSLFYYGTPLVLIKITIENGAITTGCSMYSKIIKNIFFPVYQMKLPRDERYITYMNLLNKTQWWSYSDLKKFQLQN